MYFYIEILPETLQQNAISLESMGDNNIAWHYSDIEEVVSILAEKKIIILGGDVLRANGESLDYTLDNWYVNEAQLAYDDPSAESVRWTREYIDKYVKRNGNVFLFSLVCR